MLGKGSRLPADKQLYIVQSGIVKVRRGCTQIRQVLTHKVQSAWGSGAKVGCIINNWVAMYSGIVKVRSGGSQDMVVCRLAGFHLHSL
jgi:hypothetical protein